MSYTEKYASVTGAGAHDGTSFADAWSVSEAIAGVGAGPASTPTRVNLLAGTLSQGSTSLTFNTAGTTVNQVWWRGCKTIPGDMDGNNLALAGTDIPSIAFTTGGMLVTGAHQTFSNIDVTGAATASGQFNVSGTNCLVYGCRIRYTGSSVRAVGAVASNLAFVRCYVEAGSSQPCVGSFTSGFHLYQGCYFKGGSQGWLATSSGVITMAFCIFDGPAGDAMQLSTGYGTFINNSVYNPGGHGITWTGTPANNCNVINNHFESVAGASKNAINNGSGTNTNLIKAIRNSYYNCTGTVNGLGDSPLIFDYGVLPSQGFLNPAGHDFTPTAALQATSSPGTFETISAFQNYLCNGAVQPAPGGGPVGGYMGMP